MFLLVFLSTFPVVIPFIVFQDVHPLRASNAVAIAMMFAAGHYLARHGGYRPLLTGASVVVLGVVLVGHDRPGRLTCSVRLKTRRAKHGAGPLDQLVLRDLDSRGCTVSGAGATVPAHLVERQYLDAFDVAEIGGETRDLLDLSEIVGQPGHQNVAHPHRPPTSRQAAGKRQRRGDIHAGQVSMAFGIPRLDVEQDEIDDVEIGVGEAIAVIAVGVQRGVRPSPSPPQTA